MDCIISEVSYDTVIKFLSHYGYEPVENSNCKSFEDGNYDAIDKLGGKVNVPFKRLTAYALKTDKIYDVAIIAALLAYKPSVGRGTYAKLDHPDRNKEFRKGLTYRIADFLLASIDKNYSSFDDCWDDVLKCYQAIQSYLYANDEYSYTAGKIQKIVNMAIKYFYVLFKLRAEAGKDDKLGADLFKYAPFPVDGKLIAYLRDSEMSINFESPEYNGSDAWVPVNDFSVFGRYEKAVYQKAIERGYANLIIWEFYAYNDANGING